jgi:SAM-dependent methyltransferase
MDIKATLRRMRPLVYVVHKARHRNQLRARVQAFRTYFESRGTKKLQIGTSSNVLAGWLNVDITPLYPGVFFMDATRPFPFADNSFDYVFSEHMIEHVSREEGLVMLRECFRVLKPGGRIRIATPDLEVLAGLYAREKTPEQVGYIETVIDAYIPNAVGAREGLVINQLFDFGHQFLYDPTTLRDALEAAGFSNVTRCEPGGSAVPELCGLDAHANDYIRFETVVLEATR